MTVKYQPKVDSTIFYGSTSRSGLPCLGVGGGAYTNTVMGRFVLRNGIPATAIFIRSNGDLSCHVDQAIVPVQLRDVIVEVSGFLPVAPDNPDLIVAAWVVAGIRPPGPTDRNCIDETVVFEVVPAVPAPYIFSMPEVMRGLSTYHNRDGTLFVTR